ncbi:MAG: cytochrome c [Calditrichae bacterium]|nr:cytochrome c [Calditrichota bacterium]MCB9057898.1 cytochrome c [Calditrichia bacterium]
MKICRYFLTILYVALIISCGNNNQNYEQKQPNPSGLSDFELENGIGPVKEKLALGEIDPILVQKGEEIFKAKCAACHKLDERFVGPAQRYTAERRSPEYIMNMILNPEEMTQKHPTGQKMLAEYLAPMTNMNLTKDEARQVLEYLRLLTKEGHEKNITPIPIFRNQN